MLVLTVPALPTPELLEVEVLNADVAAGEVVAWVVEVVGVGDFASVDVLVVRLGLEVAVVVVDATGAVVVAAVVVAAVVGLLVVLEEDTPADAAGLLFNNESR